MADKELRKMNRAELIEIIYALQQNQLRLETENQELQNKLQERVVKIEKAGSLAEAVVALNGVMTSAQAAADQYIESARAAAEQAEQRLAAANEQADALRTQAEAEAKAGAEALRAQAEQDAAAAWDTFRAKVRRVIQVSPEVDALLHGK